MENILVTGGAGYIGSHVIRQLIANGYTPVVVDNLSMGRKENLPESAAFVQGDFGDEQLLTQLFTDYQISSVIHLAASIEVGESVEKPVEYLYNNTISTQTLLRKMKEHGVKNIIFSSTAAVYGLQEQVPISETAPTGPVDPYGYSKLIAENLIHFYGKYAGLRGIIFRFFNACGADPEQPIFDSHKSHLITYAADVVNGKNPVLTIFGEDYPTPDGTGVRDYVHVLDIARAHVAGLKHLESIQGVETYNIGTSNGQSVKQVIAAIERVTGKTVPTKIGPRRPGDAPITVADSSKLQQQLSFKLEHSDIDNIIKTSMNSVIPDAT